ncbi:MAG TPA: nuclear transport factor 2 family protein [Jiangellaceae bacterium]|nr:nuclear transport factor 2 family protein [Jiangellaceae bacterium]
MSRSDLATTRETVRAFYDVFLDSASTPAEIAGLFAEDAEWEIPGDPDVVPWVGKHHGRMAIAEAIAVLRARTEPVSFEVDRLLAEEDAVVALGHLVTRIPATGRVIESAFAGHFTVTDGWITSYRLLEDTWTVATAVRDLTVH